MVRCGGWAREKGISGRGYIPACGEVSGEVWREWGMSLGKTKNLEMGTCEVRYGLHTRV